LSENESFTISSGYFVYPFQFPRGFVMDRINPRRDPYRLIGEIFNRRYSINEFFVSGSFGAVYRATDQKLGRAVAIKILKPDLKEDVEEMARELFQREALAAGALNHPHIVAVTDVGEDFGI
jgi:serine/threonine-protein kinase